MGIVARPSYSNAKMSVWLLCHAQVGRPWAVTNLSTTAAVCCGYPNNNMEWCHVKDKPQEVGTPLAWQLRPYDCPCSNPLVLEVAHPCPRCVSGATRRVWYRHAPRWQRLVVISAFWLVCRGGTPQNPHPRQGALKPNASSAWNRSLCRVVGTPSPAARGYAQLLLARSVRQTLLGFISQHQDLRMAHTGSR